MANDQGNTHRTYFSEQPDVIITLFPRSFVHVYYTTTNDTLPYDVKIIDLRRQEEHSEIWRVRKSIRIKTNLSRGIIDNHKIASKIGFKKRDRSRNNFWNK